MTTPPSRIKTEEELDRLETSGESFVLVDLASKLHLTSRQLSKYIQARGTAVCIDRPTGRMCGANYVRYQFQKVQA